jgi:hypothetical protein
MSTVLDPLTTTSDTIGRIPVPVPTALGLSNAFPLKTEYGYGVSRDWKVIEHRFGELATLGVQRYGLGSGARKFQFVKSSLSYTDRQKLLDFYNLTQGSYCSFPYFVPNTDRQTTTQYQVAFDTPPLSITDLANRCQTGVTFLEILDPAAAPSFNVAATCTRFPSTALASALESQVQTIIPLVHIKVRNTAVPEIYLSDRRVIVSGVPGATSSTYLPRLLSMGVPGGGDVIMSQSIDGRADNVRFVFGNADRVMAKLVKDCSLEYAQIDLSLYHVQSGILLQLWKGLIMSWQVDGSAQFAVQCSDGLYPITQSYPRRTVSRQCWKPFNQDILPGFRPCPWATAGGGHGNASSCDYFYNSPNGCLSHNMSQYFGGHPEQPQTVTIKDNGTGIIGGFFRDVVTSTSILSDSIWGQPLPEIWCNDGGTPQRAFFANCLIAAVRDESDYEDILGIVGAGPLGSYEGMSVQTNADGYKFVVSPMADGFYPQGLKLDGQLNVKGYQPALGLRQSTGSDPVHLASAITDGTDAFSLGQGTPQHWEEYDTNFSNTVFPNRIIPYAAGTALCELRYPKSAGSGLAPTTAESHSMQVPIAKGLTGSVFDASGNRSLIAGLINPFWVAANSYFRALGIDQANDTTQLSYLVLDSITNTSGTGCADIAALWVDPIVGVPLASYQATAAGQALPHYNLDLNNNTFTWLDGTSGDTLTITLAQAQLSGYVIMTSTPGKELQFQFQGTLAEFKPFRDWLTEILNCTLGYYVFEFGKLKLGIRYSAVPTDTFGLGSMLYQSLSITPIAATFEYLKLTFANVALQYQQDLAEYSDKDHAAYYGRPGAPLTSSLRSAGTSTLSQGLRVAVTRTREELGGILRPDVSANPYIEWDNNKRATFKSTLLALNNEIGQVISITHPDVPTYPGAAPGSRPGSNGPMAANTWPFRIKRWMLHSDWSVTIEADSCVDSMYDTEVGPQPTGAVPRPLPVLYFPEPLGEWAPYQIQADANDALYPGEWTFDLAQQFSYRADGVLITSAVASGHLPVNSFIPNCGPVGAKKGGITRSDTGGFIPGGTTLYIQIAAYIDNPDGSRVYSPPSEVLVQQVPNGTDTNSLTITNIQWPSVSGLTGWVLFASDAEDLICGQKSGTGLPGSITLDVPLQRSTYAVPDFDLQTLRVRAQLLIHGGVLGAPVYMLNTDRIVASDATDFAGTDDWTGRVLAIIGRQLGDGHGPFQHFNITGFTAADGTFFLDRNPIAAGIQVGDVLVVCTLGVDNSANPYVVSDPGLANASNLHTGETPNDPTRVGQIVRVIKGKSRGMQAKIVSNTATSYTLDQELPIDETSVWVVTDHGWAYAKDVEINNADGNKTTQCAVEIDNYLGINLLVEAVNIAENGEQVDDADACVRMLYIPGVQGTHTVAT